MSPIFQKKKKKTFKNKNCIKFKSYVRLEKKQLRDVSKKQLTVDIS